MDLAVDLYIDSGHVHTLNFNMSDCYPRTTKVSILNSVSQCYTKMEEFQLCKNDNLDSWHPKEELYMLDKRCGYSLCCGDL